MYAVNQIVKGKYAGTFVILGFRTVAGQDGAQIKCVNPDNHAERAPGELFLPLDVLVEI